MPQPLAEAAGSRRYYTGQPGAVTWSKVTVVVISGTWEAAVKPAKFPETIPAAIGIEPTHPSLEALKTRPVVKHLIQATPAAITAFIERHAV
ncbi:MAG: hypothetical protein H7343_16680 [Undibacterium sp.]|nr:hypothetical protein [Opitutaceae bacterium]